MKYGDHEDLRLTPEEFDKARKIGERVGANILDPSLDGKKQVFERFPDMSDEKK